MFMYGATQHGQLGIGFTNIKCVDVPQQVDSRVKFVKLTCGAGHSVALSKTGKLFSWGLNILGQLGQGDTEPRWSPTLIRNLKDTFIEEVASGAGHSLCVDNCHTLFSWGASADFQTGIYVPPTGLAGQDTK